MDGNGLGEGLGPLPVRPQCWEFAMDFLGDPEAPVVEAYVASLEAEIVRLRAAEAAERERCAKICEAQEYSYWRASEDQDFTPQDCADAIRRA